MQTYSTLGAEFEYFSESQSLFCSANFTVIVSLQIHVVGFIPPADLPLVYLCMDVFVAPYVRPATETFALTNLEAMAAGVPVIHFNTGGMRVRNDLIELTSACGRQSDPQDVIFVNLFDSPS